MLWEPTRFSLEGEADFLAPGETPQRFRYELTIGRRPADDGTQPDHFVSREALVHFPKGRRRRLLERRDAEGSIYVSRDLGVTARDHRLKAIGPGRSALATLALLNVPLATRFALWWKKRVWHTTNITRQGYCGDRYASCDRLVGGPQRGQRMGPRTNAAERLGDPGHGDHRWIRWQADPFQPQRAGCTGSPPSAIQGNPPTASPIASRQVGAGRGWIGNPRRNRRCSSCGHVGRDPSPVPVTRDQSSKRPVADLLASCRPS